MSRDQLTLATIRHLVEKLLGMWWGAEGASVVWIESVTKAAYIGEAASTFIILA